MDKERAAYIISVLQGYIKGKPIQVRKNIKEATNKDGWSEFSDWEDDPNPLFDLDSYEYRIKPTPTYRPFANAEECWQEMLKHQPFGWLKGDGAYFHVIFVEDRDISYGNATGSVFDCLFCDGLKSFTFADGAVFGVKVETEE